MIKLGRAAVLPPFRVMDVIAAANARAARGDLRVLRMMAGQPAVGAPLGAVEAASAAMLSRTPLGYTETAGNLALRERIAQHYAEWYDQAVPASRIFVTTGGSGAFPLAFLAAFDPGDRIALAAPYYPPYVNILRALGMVPQIIEAGPETGFQPSVAMLQALDPKPAGLLIASPANPSGTMLTPADFAAIAAWCGHNQVRLISDEIYHGLTWGPAPSTAANLGSAVVINSFSKYFAMTGWRIGWMVLPEDMVRVVDCLAGNFAICPPHVAQVAALAAFDCHAELQGNLAVYQSNRDLLLAGLADAGFSRFANPDGAFYVYADISDRGEAASLFCARLLEQAGVALCPGLDFDAGRGEHFVRISYCGARADIEEALTRLRAWR